MRGYATLLTAIVADVISCGILWILTSMEFCHVLAWGFFIGLAAAVAFAYATEKDPEDKREDRAVFMTDETGLSVLIQRSGR